jgi:ABC-type multidrug transport system ATPase subunit
MLLDEPTVGLDPQIRTELWSLIDALRTEGTTILMSTHYIEEAERLADEVAVMAHGKIIARGRPSELIAEHAGRETAEVYGPPAVLAEARATAEREGWHDVAKLLADVEGKPAAEIAKKVMAALDWLQKEPEHRAFALQLQMVALNLKNLK